MRFTWCVTVFCCGHVTFLYELGQSPTTEDRPLYNVGVSALLLCAVTPSGDHGMFGSGEDEDEDRMSA